MYRPSESPMIASVRLASSWLGLGLGSGLGLGLRSGLVRVRLVRVMVTLIALTASQRLGAVPHGTQLRLVRSAGCIGRLAAARAPHLWLRLGLGLGLGLGLAAD